MTIETILINADCEASLPRLLDVARSIASRYHAHIVGLSLLPPSVTRPAGTPGAPDTAKIDAHRAHSRSEADRTHRLFDRLTATDTDPRTWTLDEGDGRSEIDALIGHARLADLIVASNVDGDERALCPFLAAERLVVESGRPTILVPKGTTQTQCGRRILVAWNGSREATRAIFDALPLLQAAQHVKVLQVGTGNQPRFAGLSGTDVCGMLHRHRVRATAQSLSLPRATAGAALLSAIKAENADLLVMGAYGHWRFRELVLGGATRHVMRHMTVPVLMAH